MTTKLNRISAVADVGAANSATVTLSWQNNAQFDLLCFYRTKTGLTGGVYPLDFPGGDIGNLLEKPYIQIQELVRGNEKNLKISNLAYFKDLWLVCLIHEQARLRKKKPMYFYKPRIQIIFDNDEAVRMHLYSKKIGAALLFCKILPTPTGGLAVEFVRDIMSFKTFQDTVPGAQEFDLNPLVVTRGIETYKQIKAGGLSVQT